MPPICDHNFLTHPVSRGRKESKTPVQVPNIGMPVDDWRRNSRRRGLSALCTSRSVLAYNWYNTSRASPSDGPDRACRGVSDADQHRKQVSSAPAALASGHPPSHCHRFVQTRRAPSSAAAVIVSASPPADRGIPSLPRNHHHYHHQWEQRGPLSRASLLSLSLSPTQSSLQTAT